MSLLGRFQDDETQLRNFTARYCKKKSIGDIKPGDLKHWGKLTAKTEGRFLAKYMSPKLWSDSIKSLQTAIAIVIAYTPEPLKESDHFQSALLALRQRLLREIAKGQGDRFKLKPKPKGKK